MYAKLFGSILTSSVWSQSDPTRIVWITLLALADREGNVRASPSGLARMANVTPEHCAAALACFLAPDPESSTQEHEGRRVEEIPGGWFLLNYPKYRDLVDAEARKAQWRESSKKHRQKKSGQSTPVSEPSAPRQRKSAPTDTELSTDTSTPTTKPAARTAAANWLTPYLDAHAAQFPGSSTTGIAGRYAKVFKRLEATHTPAEILRRWTICLQVKGTFATPEELEKHWPVYDGTARANGAPPRRESKQEISRREIAAYVEQVERSQSEREVP